MQGSGDTEAPADRESTGVGPAAAPIEGAAGDDQQRAQAKKLAADRDTHRRAAVVS